MSTNISEWTCINGGMDRITNGMLQIIESKTIMDSPVSSLLTLGNCQVSLIVNGIEEKKFAHIISTVPSSAS